MFHVYYEKYETTDYWIYEDILIFKPKFNKNLDQYKNITKNFNKIIFSNYDDLELVLETGNKYNSEYNNNYVCNKFNQPINLDEKLEYLKLGTNFNQSIKFNPNLTHLVLDCEFNQKIILPNTLVYLELNCNNQFLVDNLPNSIQTLVLGFIFNLKIDNLPNSIKHIKFLSYYYNEELNDLPNSIELLELPNSYKLKIMKIPKNLKKIKCNKNYYYIYDIEQNNIKIEYTNSK